MVQEFHVVRCFSCQSFQVQQVKKVNRWSCKLCGEKQSLLKEFGRGSGADCRRHVQKLNAMRGALMEEQEYNSLSLWKQVAADREDEPEEERVEQTQVSCWSKYLDTPEKAAPEEEEEEENVLIDGQQLHGIKMIDRKRKRSEGRTDGRGQDSRTPGQPHWSSLKRKPVTPSDTTPSLNHTQTSSLNHTQTSSLNHTGAPSLNHTGAPSLNHTQTSSLNHTGAPSLNHTGAPSLNHTQTSSLNHTGAPSLNHTQTSSLNHTGAPSLNHTGAPSLNHTQTSSLNHPGAPSLNHTGAPSLNHTQTSSLNHTGAPSLNHTGAPSLSMGPMSRWVRFLSSDCQVDKGMKETSVSGRSQAMGGAMYKSCHDTISQTPPPNKPRLLFPASSMFESGDEFNFDDEFLTAEIAD